MKEIKKKKCKECPTVFTPYRTTDQTCSTSCAKKRAEKRVKHKEARTVSRSKSERKTLEGIAVAIFNKYIRLRDRGKGVYAVISL